MHMSLSSLRPPGPMVAYLPEAAPDVLAEYLVAFANTDGGTIVVGLDDKGRAVGSVYAEELEGVLRAAVRQCRPSVVTGWDQLEGPTGPTYAITVPRSPELHSLADGRVLIRAGIQNRPLGGEEIRHLAATKSSSDFEAESMAGAARGDLDDEVIAEYLEKRQQRQRRVITQAPDELLREIGALNDAGQ